MGTVYRAVDERTGETVALKLLTSNDATSPAQQQRFLREGRALSKVRHPHVVRLREVGSEGGRPYLVVDYHAAGSLQDALRKGPLEPAAALRLGQQLAEGLAAAHAVGVLHRDLKPDNILLDANGDALLTDFGLAKDLERQGQTAQLSKSGTLLGTPGYLAPEQAVGDLAAIGEHTDVYGAGAVLYAALAGTPPFTGADLHEVLVATVERPPRALRVVRPEVPAALAAVVHRCLEKDPAARYASAQELAEELERVARGAPPAPSRARSPVVPLISAGIVLSGVVAAAVLLRGGGSPPSLTAGPPPVASPPPKAAAAPAPQPLDPATRARLDGLLAQVARLREANDPVGALLACEQALGLAPDSASIFALRAEVKREHGDIQGAIADFERAASLAPTTADYVYGRGATRHVSGDLQGALADYDRALALDPQLQEALRNRGVARRALGDLAGALADYDRAVALDPEDATALANRGNARRDAGDLPGALADYDRAIALDPQGGPYLARGDVRGESGDPRGALADYDMELLLRPGDFRVHHNRGKLQLQLEDYRAAEADFSRALLLHPTPETLLGRATARSALGDEAGAVEDYDQILALDPDLPDILEQRAESKLQLGDSAGALADADRALAADAALPLALLTRARARLALDQDLALVLADLDRSLELDPGLLFARNLRGVIRRRRGDLRGALDDYDRVLSGGAGDAAERAVVLGNRGNVRQDLQDLQGALEDYTRALELAPNLRVYDSRARVRAALKDLPGALADMDRAVEAEPRQGQLLAQRGQLRLDAGDVAGAVADWSAALELELDPELAEQVRQALAEARAEEPTAPR